MHLFVSAAGELGSDTQRRCRTSPSLTPRSARRIKATFQLFPANILLAAATVVCVPYSLFVLQ